MIPETFLSSGISTADVVAGDPVYCIDLCNLHDDETIVAGSKSKSYRINKVDTTLFYDEFSRAHLDGDAGVSVTNLVSILQDAKYLLDKFKIRVRVYGATSKEIFTLRAVDF